MAWHHHFTAAVAAGHLKAGRLIEGVGEGRKGRKGKQ